MFKVIGSDKLEIDMWHIFLFAFVKKTPGNVILVAKLSLYSRNSGLPSLMAV